jgi:hypothetical protein
MEVEYKKDLRHNYMIIKENDKDNMEIYSLKMLEAQEIEGILPVESRRMDNSTLLYYDITAKQSMAAILDKAVLSYDKIKSLCTGIIDIIDRAYEYLLSEDDFILAPEYIYIEVTSNRPVLCFLPGFGKRVKEQMSSLIEFLMNKVDYNDKEAVLLVYQLYADSREEGYTFDHLAKVLQVRPKVEIGNKEREKVTNEPKYSSKDSLNDSSKDSSKAGLQEGKMGYTSENSAIHFEDKSSHNVIEKRNNNDRNAQQKNKNNIESRIPVMMERVESEQEMPCYPVKTYLFTGACVIAGILLVAICLKTGIIYNSFGSRIDYSKLFAMILIILCAEGYLIKLIWDKKNRITKIITKKEYIDPRKNADDPESPRVNSEFPRIKTDFPWVNSESPQANSEFPRANSALPQSRKLKRTILTDNGQGESLNKSGGEAAYVSQDHPEDGQYDTPYLSKKGAAFGTAVYHEEEDNPTCLLNADVPTAEDKPKAGSNAAYILKPVDEANYQTIQITGFPFFIGKLKKNVDYCLENEAVSRYHAKLTNEEKHYYITDLNSTNGTFVNAKAVKTYDKKEINIGDEIAFANIRYLFTAN